MTAPTLTVGDRVRTTAEYLRRRVGKRPLTGTVVGFSRILRYVRVRPDGRRSASRYHRDFWERLPT